MESRQKKKELIEIVSPLLGWYERQARCLPWREEPSAYRVWISEIMLQQTRVEAVKPYFERFLKELPTIKALAEAGEEQLLKLWEGLGYYNRVRNLQKAAQTIVKEYDGEIPMDYEKLLSLSGIGPYTAGAIASIAFDLPYAAVGGNVLRIITRLTSDDQDISLAKVKKDISKTVTEILPDSGAGSFNQALMELGATVCIPNGKPLCDKCPLKSYCSAYAENRVLDFPVKAPKKARRIEHRMVFFIACGKEIAIRKRPAKGLLSGLWELPNTEKTKDEISIFQQLLDWNIIDGSVMPLGKSKHIFTHIEWQMQGYYVVVQEKGKAEGFVWVDDAEIRKQYALPSAFQYFYECGIKHLKE